MPFQNNWKNTKQQLSKLTKSSLLKSISIYTFFRVINRTVPVVLLPFLTHYLSPKDYGIVDFYLLWLLLLTPLVGLNTSNSAGRFYYDKDELDYPVYISSVFYFNLLTAITWLIVVFSFGTFILKNINIEVGLSFLFYLVLNAAFNQISIIQLTNWRVRNKPIPYGILGLVRTVTEIGLSVILVKFFIQNWEGRILGQYMGAFIAFGVSAYFMVKDGLLKWSFNFDYLKKAINYGAPLILHSIGGILIGYSNRFFIYKFLDVEAAGIFASAFQIGLAVALLQSSFNEAWVPYFFNLLKNSNNHKTRLHIVKVTYLYFASLIVLTAFLIVLLPFIYRFIGDQYDSGQSLSMYIMIAYLFNGMYKMFGNYLFFLKKTKIIAFGTILTLAFNLVLNYFLIPEFGLNGAAASLAISFFLEFLIFVLIAQYFFKMPWFFNKKQKDDAYKDI